MLAFKLNSDFGDTLHHMYTRTARISIATETLTHYLLYIL